MDNLKETLAVKEKLQVIYADLKNLFEPVCNKCHTRITMCDCERMQGLGGVKKKGKSRCF